MMIRIGLLMIVVVLAGACNTAKPAAEEKTKTEEAETGELKKEDFKKDVKDDNYYLGLIDMTNSCGPVIQVKKGTERYTFNPTNLEPKFAVNGLRVKLNFIRLPEKGETGCLNYEAIKITEIFAVR